MLNFLIIISLCCSFLGNEQEHSEVSINNHFNSDTTEIIFVLSFYDTVKIHLNDDEIFNDIIKTNTYHIDKQKNTFLKALNSKNWNREDVLIFDYKNTIVRYPFEQKSNYLYVYFLSKTRDSKPHFYIYPDNEYHEGF